MPSTPTSILRYELQAAQANTGSWYVNLNRLIDRFEDSIAGFLDIPIFTGDYDLSAEDYISDEGRMAYIRLSHGQTLTGGVRVRTSTPRLYFVHNDALNDDYAVAFGGDNDHLAIIPQGYGQLILVHDDLTISAVGPLITGTGLIQEDVFGDVADKLPVATENFTIAVESSLLSTPPGSPTSGQRWIVAPTGVNAWTGKDSKIAIWGGSSWSFVDPSAGMMAFDKAAHTVTAYDPVQGWTPAVAASMFPTGGVTYMLFAQAAAPTGWTKKTTHDNKMLRVVSGTPSSGGSVNFSTVFGLTAVTSKSVVQANIPNVNLQFTNSAFMTNISISGTAVVLESFGSPEGGQGGHGGGVTPGYDFLAILGLTKTYSPVVQNVGLNGSSTAHAHDIDLRVKYADVMIATLD